VRVSLRQVETSNPTFFFWIWYQTRSVLRGCRRAYARGDPWVVNVFITAISPRSPPRVRSWRFHAPSIIPGAWRCKINSRKFATALVAAHHPQNMHTDITFSLPQLSRQDSQRFVYSTLEPLDQIKSNIMTDASTTYSIF
jgi:hypothetical protein